MADGQEIARGTCNCLLEEAREIVLQPIGKTDAEMARQSLKVNFTVEGYTRSRPADTVAIKFDLLRAAVETGGESAGFITKGAGVATLGNDLIYGLEQVNLSGDKKYELKFNVRLGNGEQAD
jgi:hypothetical protein